MGIKSNSQQKKELVKRTKADRLKRIEYERSLDKLPEIEKLEYEISMLNTYINRYKNDLSNGLILHKVNTYKKQIEEKQKQLLEALSKIKENENERDVREEIKVPSL